MKKSLFPANWQEYTIADCLHRVELPVDVNPTTLYTQIGIRSHGKGLFYKEPVTGESLGNKAVYWIEPDCFVLNIVFAWEQAIGKTTQAEVGMIGSHRFPMYKPVDNIIDIDYLIFYLLTKRGTDILEAASPGGAGRNRTLGQDRFLKSKIMLPPIAEQKKIAAILTTQDKVIELKEKRLAEKQRQKNSLINLYVSGKKRLPGYTDKWKSKSFSEIGDIVSGGTPTTSQPNYWDGDIPWCTPTDITKSGKYISRTEKTITKSGLENSSANLLPPNSILMCSRASIGPRSINTVPMATNQGFKSLICDPREVNLLYIYDLIELCIKDFVKLSSGSTFLELSKGDFASYTVKLPSLKEQEAIVQILSTADRELDLLQQDLDQEKKKKKALMQLLLTGKVRVNV